MSGKGKSQLTEEEIKERDMVNYLFFYWVKIENKNK